MFLAGADCGELLQHPPCLPWGRKGAGRGVPGTVLPKGELVPKPSEVMDQPVPWCLFPSCVHSPKQLVAGEG